MATHVLRTLLRIERPIAEVFDFFSRAENLGEITPPELGFEMRTPVPIEMRPGAVIDYAIRLHGVPMKWRTLITAWNPPHEFVDEQARGPYAEWIHAHRFRADGPGATIIEDEVRYRLPFGPLGSLVHPLVRRQLDRIFAYRELAVRRRLSAAPAPAA